MKENRAHWFLSWLTGRGTYQETKFEEDAERVIEFYRDHGYVRAQVGEPELKDLGESKDKKTKWIRAAAFRSTRAIRYRVNNFQIAGNTVVKTDALMPLFKLKNGDYYSQKLVRKGFQKAQEIYGAGGYMEFTGYPDFKFSDEPDPAEPNTPTSLVAVTPTETKPSVRRPSTSRCGSRKASSTSSTGSSSPATRRRATTSSAASCGCTRTTSSTPKR